MSQMHREHPELDDEQIEALQAASLMRVPMPAGAMAGIDYEVRRCRDCQRPFNCKIDRPTNSKWGALCASCLAYEC